MASDSTGKASVDHVCTVLDPPNGRSTGSPPRPAGGVAMAHLVLRMCSYEPGHETAVVPGRIKQRPFASAREQEQILDAVRAGGTEPHELETEGWLPARLPLSRPTDPRPTDPRGRP